MTVLDGGASFGVTSLRPCCQRLSAAQSGPAPMRSRRQEVPIVEHKACSLSEWSHRRVQALARTRHDRPLFAVAWASG